MRPQRIKDRCTKKKLNKCDSVVRAYDKVQAACADILDRDPNIVAIRCNVPLPDFEEGAFASDFVCTKTDGELLVRECVFIIVSYIKPRVVMLCSKRKNCSFLHFDFSYHYMSLGHIAVIVNLRIGAQLFVPLEDRICQRSHVSLGRIL